MRRSVLLLATLATAVLLASGVALAESPSANNPGKHPAAGSHAKGGGKQATMADLDAALKKSFKQSDAPGVVAAVQTPRYTWVRALGVRNRTTKKPMTTEVYHRIGSVTKTFTATLLLQAEGDGLLSLDDTIDQYIKGVPNGDEITLRQMATMTSGIATYSENRKFDFNGDPGTDP